MSEGIDFVLETLVSNEEKEKFIEEMKLYQAKISKVFNTMAHQLMIVSHPRELPFFLFFSFHISPFIHIVIVSHYT